MASVGNFADGDAARQQSRQVPDKDKKHGSTVTNNIINMKSSVKVIVALLVIGTGVANAAVVVTNDVLQDTYINSSDPNSNFGTDSFLIVAAPGTGAGGDYRALMTFNLPTLSDVVITNATLSLVNWNFGGTGAPMTQSIYTVTSSWSQNTATWNNANGLYNPTDVNVSTATFTPTNNFETYTFDVTAIVNSWYANSVVNYGFYILSTYTDSASFASYASSNLGYASPGLTITYTAIPEPGTIGLIAASGMLLLVFRKRRDL